MEIIANMIATIEDKWNFIFRISSVPTFFRGERLEMAIAAGVFRSVRVQAIDLLGLFRTWSNSGFVEFHRDYAQV